MDAEEEITFTTPADDLGWRLDDIFGSTVKTPGREESDGEGDLYMEMFVVEIPQPPLPPLTQRVKELFRFKIWQLSYLMTVHDSNPYDDWEDEMMTKEKKTIDWFRWVLIGVSCLFLAFVLPRACSRINSLFNSGDDNAIEEAVEHLIEAKTGISVDLTPNSPE